MRGGSPVVQRVPVPLVTGRGSVPPGERPTGLVPGLSPLNPFLADFTVSLRRRIQKAETGSKHGLHSGESPVHKRSISEGKGIRSTRQKQNREHEEVST